MNNVVLLRTYKFFHVLFIGLSFKLVAGAGYPAFRRLAVREHPLSAYARSGRAVGDSVLKRW